MKHKLFLAIMLLSATATFAQKQGLSIHFGAYDFYGPQTGNDYLFFDKNKINYGVDNAPNDTTVKSGLAWQPLVKIAYWFQLGRWFDINLGLSLADAEYPHTDKDQEYIDRQLYYNSGLAHTDQFLGEFDARINFNILDKRRWILSPYITTGITASYHNVWGGFDFPAGLGVNVKLDKNLYLNLESAYKVALTDRDFDHVQHTVGVVYWFKPGYRKPKVEDAPVAEAIAPPTDSDHDGVPDSIDKCPTIAGSPEFDGCPDSDGDGIADDVDECPLVAGIKAFNGCPDSDGDGIADNKDKCPYMAGTAQYNGCPPPDADHDGVPDDVDKCPNEAGPASNGGCPEVKQEIIEKVSKAGHDVFFETGKAILKKTSYKSLDAIAKVMKEDQTLKLNISGYTDNTGKEESNMRISEARANACRDYIISQGVSGSRITSKGFGPANPVADNKTAIGRAQNRRTEFKIHN